MGILHIKEDVFTTLGISVAVLTPSKKIHRVVNSFLSLVSSSMHIPFFFQCFKITRITGTFLVLLRIALLVGLVGTYLRSE